jgi:Glycosyltransferases involved in cell wall biogenesis
MKPLVSVIILSYYNIPDIYPTLSSVLEQTYEDIEIIFSDDGTPGFTDEIENINAYISRHQKGNIKNVVFNAIKENSGTVKNLNSAIRLSHGKYVKGVSSEDKLARPDALSIYVNFMELHDSKVAFAKMRGVTPEGKYYYKLQSCDFNFELLRSYTVKQTRSRLFSRNFLPAPTWMIRSDVFKTYGLFSEKMRLIEDYPYWLYLTEKNVPFDYLDEIMMDYKLSGVSSAGSYSETFMKDMLKIYDEFIFPYDKRYGILQPLYNALKRAGLNFYMQEAKRNSMSRTQKIYARIKYLPFWIMVSFQNKVNKFANQHSK